MFIQHLKLNLFMNSNSSNIESKKRKCMYEYNCLNAKKITNENEFMDPLEETKLYMTKFRKWNITRRCEVLHNILGELNQFEIKFIMKAIKPNFQRDFIKQLPVNVAIQIIQRIPSKYMLSVLRVSKYWNTVSSSDVIWKHFCLMEGFPVDRNSIDDIIYVTNAKLSNCKNNSIPTNQFYLKNYVRYKNIEYNWKSCKPSDKMLMRGHDDHVITCLEYCGDLVVSASDDNTVNVWSANTGECLATMLGHTGGVWACKMNPEMLATGSTDRSIRIWKLHNYECKFVLLGHSSTVRCLALYKDRLMSGSRDADLRLWSLSTGECLSVFSGHTAAVRCLQFTEKYLISGSYDCTVRVWNHNKQNIIHVLTGHTNRIYSLEFDGSLIVSGSLDTCIRIWNVVNGCCMHVLVGHSSLTSGLKIVKNILISANADTTLRAWDLITGRCLHVFSSRKPHTSAITCMEIVGDKVVSASDDGTVKLWNLYTGNYYCDLVKLVTRENGGVVWRLRCSRTKLVCAMGSRNGTEETKLVVLNFEAKDFLMLDNR